VAAGVAKGEQGGDEMSVDHTGVVYSKLETGGNSFRGSI